MHRLILTVKQANPISNIRSIRRQTELWDNSVKFNSSICWVSKWELYWIIWAFNSILLENSIDLLLIMFNSSATEKKMCTRTHISFLGLSFDFWYIGTIYMQIHHLNIYLDNYYTVYYTYINNKDSMMKILFRNNTIYFVK